MPREEPKPLPNNVTGASSVEYQMLYALWINHPDWGKNTPTILANKTALFTNKSIALLKTITST